VRLFHKLVLLMLAAALVPLGALGLLSARSAEEALRRRIEEHHLKLAQNGADLTALYLENLITQLRAIAQYRNLRSTPEVTTGVLRVAYRQIDDAAVVALVGEGGLPLVDPVYLADPQQHDLYRRHSAATAVDVAALFAHVPGRPSLLPLSRLRAGEAAFGPVHIVADGSPRMAVAIPVDTAEDPRGASRLALIADLSLGPLGARIVGLSSAGAEALLLDADGRVIADAAGPQPAAHVVDVPGAGRGGGPVVAAYLEDHLPMLGAFAPVKGSRFGLLVRQRAAAAYAPVAELRRRTLLLLGLSTALAALLAALFVRHLTARVRRLASGAAQIGAGQLDVRLPEAGADEVAELARSMNDMAGRLGTQRDEILEWNRTLEARVAEKSRELAQAQEMLLRSQKLAAIGELGAGMAHEINNPLAGVLGLAQLARLDTRPDDPRREMLDDLERQALRIKEIVANLLRFTQQAHGDFEALERVDVQKVLEHALSCIGQAELGERGIQIRRVFGADVPPVRGVPGQLEEAFVQILTNARNAMPRGGELTVETVGKSGRLVQIRIADTGTGINPEHLDRIFDPFFTTKADWGATGLGLSIVHRIVEAHGGRIAVESVPGQGATFVLTLPADAGGPQLV
jgi:signal transduction histidine kinase